MSASRWDLNFWIQLPLAVVITAVLAFVMGLISMRTNASHFVILTLVLSELMVLALHNWKSVTKGSLGIIRPGAPDPLFGIEFDSFRSMYYLSVRFLALTLLTPWG